MLLKQTQAKIKAGTRVLTMTVASKTIGKPHAISIYNVNLHNVPIKQL